MTRAKLVLPPGSATSNFAGSTAGVTFDAGPGHDTVLGSRHADAVQGGEGNDGLLGKGGDDALQGGAGLDAVAGGAGSDAFVFAPGDLITSRAASNGHKGRVDRIADFQGAGTSGQGEQDVIRLEGFGAGTTLAYVGQDGGAQLYEVVDPTTAGADGFISVSLAGGAGGRLTADDVVVVPPPAPQVAKVTEGANSASFAPAISADGSTVAFESYASNLVDGEVDGNGDVLDVLVVDLATGKAVNVTGGGDAASFGASVSADGSAVAFSSAATNLVEGQGDGNHAPDIFVHDLATGETVNLSLTIGHGGSFEPSISADGSRVAFRLDGDGTQDILVMDTATSAQEGGGWIEVTEGGDGSSFAPSLSGDGSRVAFESTATNLVAGEADANGATADVFLHDLTTGETINVTEGGDAASFGASVSADGSKVVFTSAATNLVAGETDGDGGALDVFLFDLDTGEVTNVTEGWAGEVASAGISADGSTVAFLHLPPDQQPTPYDPIYERDLILHDVATGEAANVTEGWDGYVARASVSADGSEGTFSAVPKAGMYTDVFVWEMS